MKKEKAFLHQSRLIFFAGCFLCFILSPGLYAETKTIELTAGDYQLEQTDTGEYRIIMLSSGYSDVDSPTDPLLPQKIVEVKVPHETDLSGLHLTIDSREEISISSFDIIPQPPVQINEDDFVGEGKSVVNGRNLYVYERDAFFPREAIELLPPVTRKEIDPGYVYSPDVKPEFTITTIIRVAYRPFLYNPVRQKLILLKKATITLTYDGTNESSLRNTDRETDLRAVGDGADYVIITSNTIVANSLRLADFLRMKEREGHSVRIVTENDYGTLTGQAPNGIAEKIRQWLINNYQPVNSGIDYVLLIGNPDPDDPLDDTDTVGDIPMKMVFPNYYGPDYRIIPTDYFYADLTGNWDLDGDHIYGVSVDLNNPESPDTTIDPDTFSARWTGKIQVDFNETYQFSTFSDDGVRVYIDGNQIINNWTQHTPALDSAALPLSSGQHDIQVEFYENTAGAVMKLYWKTTASTNVANQIIPQTHLFYFNSVTGNYIVGGLNATYFNNSNFTGTTLTRIDNDINFTWATGDRGTGEWDTGSEVYVGRIPVYNNNYGDLDDILGKIIRYETDPGNINWRKSLLLPMKPLTEIKFAYPVGEAIRNDFALAAGFQIHRIYEENYNPPTPETFPCTYTSVLNEWQKGYGMVTWWTHGCAAQIACNVFKSSQAPSLNDTMPAFTLQASCGVGNPDYDDNLGYSLLKQGAIATVSASRVSTSVRSATGGNDNPTSTQNQYIAYNYTKHIIDGGFPKSAGVGLAETKGVGTYVSRNILVYNLYGDPDCYLLQTNPNQLPVAEANGPYTSSGSYAITLDGNGSFDPEGSSLSYRWDLDNDGAFDTGWSISPSATFSKSEDYTGTVRLQVKDDVGFTGEDTALVTFLNVIPPCGDVNSDGMIDIIDALLIAQVYVDLQPSFFDESAADVNGDGFIDIIDALLIAQYYVGLIQTLPGCV
ncbi:MAG: hypothetical protein JXJ04_22075 [Spirochaetales bacterium]|nr:hypothetical protein [Spirochaetales bacterium]